MIVLVLAGALLASSAEGQTLAIPAAADTYLRQSNTNKNQGLETVLQIRQSGHNRALVRMDQTLIAAAVGSGSLASATLELYVSSAGSWGADGRTVDLHRMTADWTELGATWNCPNDTNTLNSQPNCATQWDGGSFDSEPSDSVLHTNSTAGYVQFNVTADVRAFLAGTANYGWMAKLDDETLAGNADYVSRQGLPLQAPRLVLVIESPLFDQVPPSLAITAPTHSVLINETSPQIALSYSDGGSGVALSSLSVKVDGVAANCTSGASSATCLPSSALGEGSHTITASLRDQAGNEATASRGFTLLVGPGRRSATFTAVGDTYVRQGDANQNFGTETVLRIRQTGKNRSLARFDAAEVRQAIGQGTLVAASLELTITKNGANWSKTGRPVDVHRLTADWTETGATWNCGIDTQPANSQPDCSPQWAGGTFQSTPTASVLHTNTLAGTVSFDVTADVSALLTGTSAYGWLLKKRDESLSGLVEYASREAGSANAPRLVVVFDLPPGSQDTTPPTIAITAPSGTIYNNSAPSIRVEYSDPESGVDLTTLSIRIDGSVANCTVSASFAVCAPSALGPGEHAVTAEIKNRAGLRAATSEGFVLAEDTEPPTLEFQSPLPPLLYNQTSPVITLAFADDSSGVDTTTFRLTIDGTDMTAACVVSADTATCHPANLAAGERALAAEIRDRAGNRSTASLTLRLDTDTTPPTLAIVSPQAAAAFPLGQLPAITFSFADGGSGIDTATFAATVDGVPLSDCSFGDPGANCTPPALAVGHHSIAVSIRDRAGNEATRSGAFDIDPERIPPVVTIVSPVAGPMQGATVPQIEVQYADAVSGVDPATVRILVDGVDATAGCQVGPASASCPARLASAGAHRIEVEVSDHLGNLGRASVEVVLSIDLALTVTAPANGTLTRESTIDFTGTVSPETESVRVGDVAGTVQNGTFSVPGIPLREGSNTLTVVAQTSAGGIGSATVIVVRDTEAPGVAILSPRDGFVTSASQIVVSGEILDSASSSAAVHPVKVLVNGQTPALERKTFVLADLLLVPGENRIEVTAEDAAGNVGRSEVTVRYVADAAARIEKISGDFQQAPVRDTLTEPLLVRVVDFLGRPLAGRTVDFAVTRGDGAVISFPNAARRLSVMTNEDGLATVQFALGTRAGAGNQEVTVSSLGIPGAVVFCASARNKAAHRISPIVGTDFTGARSGTAGQVFPKPLLAQVFDEHGNPVPGVAVTFRSVAGGGGFAGVSETTQETDGEGKAVAIFTLGPDEGINNNVVEATFEGSEPVRFVISGLVPGPAELTSISGVLLDPQEDPVPGALMHVGANATHTDAQGRFRLTGVPVGTVHLGIGGATVTRPGTWPDLGYELVTISGRDNTLGKPLRLPQVDAGGRVWVGGDQDVVVPMRGVAGASLTVFAHSATFPDGKHEGWVSFTQVPTYKVPMVAPMGSNFQLAWTLQPAGVRFDPPARVTLPNFDNGNAGGAPPGSTLEVFSFDHDLEEFVSCGLASVSEDGRQLVSNPGMGIAKAGWGGAPPPPPPPAGTCSAGTCTMCPPSGPPVSHCTTCEICKGGCRPQEITSFEIQTDGDEEAAAPQPARGAAPQSRLGTKASSPSTPRVFGVGQTAIFAPTNLVSTCTGDTKIVWDFDDHGATSNDTTARHAFPEAKSYHVTAKLECKSCPQPGYVANETVQVVDLIEGHFKVLSDEIKLAVEKDDEDGDGKPDNFFRTLGGFRIKLSIASEPLIGAISEYRWSANGGHFYDGNETTAHELTGAALNGANLDKIWWEADPTINQDLTVEVRLVRQGTYAVRLQRRIKTRVLSSGIMPGDDVRMLTRAYRQIGFSSTPFTYRLNGVGGAPVPVTDQFDATTEMVVEFQQKVDQITRDGQVGNQALAKLRLHWKDYLAAVESPPLSSTPTVDIHHSDFETWLTGLISALQTVYPDALHQTWTAVSYRDFVRSWVVQETGTYGHWGFNGTSHRITVSTFDEAASMGFSQIVNKYKYGSRILLSGPAPQPNLDLYKPDEALTAFGLWSARQDLGAGFYRSFAGGRANHVTTIWAPFEYPRIANLGQSAQQVTYDDSTQDLVSKGLYSYNGSAFDAELSHFSWPDMLRRFLPLRLQNMPVNKAIDYALDIKGRSHVGTASWQWVDAVAIRTGPDRICDSTPGPGDIPITVNPTGPANQICICAAPGHHLEAAHGGNDVVEEVAFPYSEADWVAGRSWMAVRNRAASGPCP
jgi:hypothetical protein